MTIQPTTVWRVRKTGNNANGGGFDAGITGAGTDYSQQNTAQASGSNGTASSTTFVDSTANAFTAAMVGNALNIAGTFVMCVGYTSPSTITLDASITVTNASWKLGGAWADPFANTYSGGPIQPGNILYILGTGIPTPPYSAGADYTCPGYMTFAQGNWIGKVTITTDPATPNYATGGRALIFGNLICNGGAGRVWDNLYFCANGTFGGYGVITAQDTVKNCVYDQMGHDMPLINAAAIFVTGCEIFSSVAGVGSYPGIAASSFSTIIGNYIHNCVNSGLTLGNTSNAAFNVIANNNGDGIATAGGDINYSSGAIYNNTIDGNLGNGINLGEGSYLMYAFFNNIITNHTGVGKAGIKNSGTYTLAQSNSMKSFFDYNVFYNNTTHLTGMSAGPNDSVGVDPQYANRAGGDFSIGTNVANLGYPRSLP